MADRRAAFAAVHARHTEARWPVLRSLRLKLVLAAALWVAIVIGAITAAALGIAERRLEQDLRDTARLTALAVADDLELRAEPVGTPGMTAVLHDFLAAAPTVRDIALFTVAGDQIDFALGTSSAPAAADQLVRQAVDLGRAVAADRDEHRTAAASPVTREGRIDGVVLVTVSLEQVVRLRSEGRLYAAGIAAFAVLGITALISLLTERLVHAPLTSLLRVVSRARTGDLTARAPILRSDEIGEVAAGINTMLTELDTLQTHLRERVEAATRELRERNEQLVRSYESVLALREELARARDLATVGQTMANVAHQIGTPLNLVSAHVQLMQQELREDAAAGRRLAIIGEQVDKVTASVRELLDRARPQGVAAVVAIAPLLTRLTASVQVLASAAHVRVTLRASDPLPFVLGDETQLELALMNLITNALDAMPNGGELAIVAVAAPPGVVIEVRDTGHGIPPNLAGLIFDPWVTSKPGRGTGLGLSITRDVVQRAGGTIEFHPAANGGTIFRVALPAAASASA